MLIIREQQMAALRKSAAVDFVQRVSSHLLTSCPDTDESAIHAFIRTGIPAARAFHLTREADVAEFLRITWNGFRELPDFPRPALAILTRHTIDATGKLADYAAWVEEEVLPEPVEEEEYDA